MDWDTFFMTLVYLTGMRSKDARTHTGAVIVAKDKTIISLGYNGLPRGVEYKYARQERPEKYYWFEHAERNAIYNAIRTSAVISDSIMYTNGTPCCDCARAIIQSGIKTVVVDKSWDDNNQGKWLEHSKKSKVMFAEAGVNVISWEGDIVHQIEKFRYKKVVK